MTGLNEQYTALLKEALSKDYVVSLPPLLDNSKPEEQSRVKNLSRAFSAFAVSHICDIKPSEASLSVVDDFDDYGIDAVYYHAQTETLYLVQAKLKASSMFSQDEALAFCQGVRKLINQDFGGFNQHFQNRLLEIEEALEHCSHIQLVIAHIGAKISDHASSAMKNLLEDENHGEERFESEIINYNRQQIVPDLQGAQACAPVHTNIKLAKCQNIQEPRVTYMGLIPVSDLVDLHREHGKALYEKNIRTFLGHKTDVNAAIRKTLQDCPQEFIYLNNGVAALCDQIEPKAVRNGRKTLKVRGFSIINGAQTIASAARFVEENDQADISQARVSISLIKAGTDSQFGKAVTRARNHQNPVSLKNFVALDDEQERLRRELAHLGIRYVYKAEVMENNQDENRIQVDEAAQALSLFQHDPRFVVWLKKEPSRLLDSSTEQYKALFSSDLSPYALVNAVRFLRYIQTRMATESTAAWGLEKLTYKHGNHFLGWVLAKQIRVEQGKAVLLSTNNLREVLSIPLDNLRQLLWSETEPQLIYKGPLALFRNQTNVIPLLSKVSIQYFGLNEDPVIEIKKNQQSSTQLYQNETLFEYVISKAPQIGGLS